MMRATEALQVNVQHKIKNKSTKTYHSNYYRSKFLKKNWKPLLCWYPVTNYLPRYKNICKQFECFIGGYMQLQIYFCILFLGFLCCWIFTLSRFFFYFLLPSPFSKFKTQLNDFVLFMLVSTTVLLYYVSNKMHFIFYKYSYTFFILDYTSASHNCYQVLVNVLYWSGCICRMNDFTLFSDLGLNLV